MAMQKKHAVNFFEYNACDSIFSEILNENKDLVTLYTTIVINIPLSLLGTCTVANVWSYPGSYWHIVATVA